MMKDIFFLLSCEHGGATIPAFLKKHVRIPPAVLQSHRGYDIGALEAAYFLQKGLKAPLVVNTQTRLIADFNRSLHHPQLFSEYSNHLSEEQRHRFLQDYHSYRQKITDIITTQNQAGRHVCHVSVHSFTPQWEGKTRPVEIGLLYDPKRLYEKSWCQQVKSFLTKKLPQHRVRSNQPYKGTADGLTSFLRSQINQELYTGIEIELNQKFFKKPASTRANTVLFTELVLAFQNLSLRE